MTRITKQCRIVLRSCEISFSVQDFHHHVSRPSYRYRKPYPTWIGSVPFPPGYVMPQFCMFNAFGNPEQDLAHFLSRCGETSKNGALCLRQFNHSKELSWFYQTRLFHSWLEEWNKVKAVKELIGIKAGT